MRTFLCVLTLVGATMAANSSCTVYGPGICGEQCGRCFNPGGRAGVMCPGQQTGYYCPVDHSNFIAFACMDWTFGSSGLKKAEEAYNKRTKSNVYFGIGTYGDGNDAQRGLGVCVELTVSGIDRPILAQSINTGSDVAGDQFDLQVGDGCAGEYDTCAGGNTSMYPGTKAQWGKQYGGVDNRAQCAGLPPYPRNPGPMKAANDSLVELCQYSFDKKVRLEGGGNPSIQDIKRVPCPKEIVQFTWYQRADDVDVPVEGIRQKGFPNYDHVCNPTPGGSLSWCLTRMMDCRKPSGGFIDNMQPKLMAPGMKVVQPCTGDGYTRIDVQCGCSGCYC